MSKPSITAIFILISICFFACQSKNKLDQIYFNAQFITLYDSLPRVEAIAVNQGKIVDMGTKADLEKKYNFSNKIDLNGAFVYPGFNDAHAHFYGLGEQQFRVDLRDSKSWDDCLQKTKIASKNIEGEWIIGRGWDQNIWPDKKFPDLKKLDSIFPDKPVYLKRIDGHAAIANSYALTLAGINTQTKIEGGLVEVINGKLTGILVDNACDLLEKSIPAPSDEQIKSYLLKAQEICLKNGLTSVTDAGLNLKIVKIADSLHKSGLLKIRLNIMLNPNEENFDFAKKNGPLKTDRLTVHGFKIYMDGALGSHGACLLKPYESDTTSGFLLNSVANFKILAQRIAGIPKFQMNAHCIGDSAARVFLKIASEYINADEDRRWRMEHAQVVNPDDYYLFKKTGMIASVQPTHATSDMIWAAELLGKERILHAYAYKKLLEINNIIVLGTDFPVEQVNPILTWYSSIIRKNKDGIILEPFKENILEKYETMMGMTYFPAFAEFRENEKGKIRPGMWADFTLLDRDLFKTEENDILNTKIIGTIIAGEKVF